MNRSEAEKFLPVFQAFAEGKQVQIYDISNDRWNDIDEPEWCSGCEYRVKPEKKTRRMTYRELSEWLAKGNGQLRLRSGDISIYVIYTKDNSYVSDGMMIRKWDSDEWVEPVIEEVDE